MPINIESSSELQISGYWHIKPSPGTARTTNRPKILKPTSSHEPPTPIPTKSIKLTPVPPSFIHVKIARATRQQFIALQAPSSCTSTSPHLKSLLQLREISLINLSPQSSRPKSQAEPSKNTRIGPNPPLRGGLRMESDKLIEESRVCWGIYLGLEGEGKDEPAIGVRGLLCSPAKGRAMQADPRSPAADLISPLNFCSG